MLYSNIITLGTYKKDEMMSKYDVHEKGEMRQ